MPLTILLLFLFIAPIAQLGAQIAFPAGSLYSYLKGSEASTLNSGWKADWFDDSGWATGVAPFRYGDGSGGTELSDMRGKYTTLYLRTVLTVSQLSKIESVQVEMNYDDGFIIWINGVEVLRKNAPTPANYLDSATASHEFGTPEIFIIPAMDMNLKEGNNQLAIQAFNVGKLSTDFYLDCQMIAETLVERIPDTPRFSIAGKITETSFPLQISSPDTSMDILYTLDGSFPETSLTAIQAESPVEIWIHPDSTTGRPKTPAVMVRAALTGKEGFRPSFPVTHTYIFPSRVRNQVWPGGDWPNTNVNGQVIDLSVDSKVTNDVRYTDQIESSLTSIPSLSIVTSLENLFDPVKGIYVNAEGHGESWERECAVELIYPDGTTGFTANAGLRIRGGWSRHDDFPKHSFRLFFNASYGTSKLRYPLFGEEGADKFDKMDIRTSQNYSWANNPWDGVHNTFARETFSRDLQGAMGRPYTRSRYYHLYLNGMYWGLYETQERSEADYASSYFGGKDEDYDVVKVNTENYSYQVEATDGTLSAWRTIWNMCETGFSSNANYYNLEGKDASGKRISGAKQLVDIDNLIDYMLIIFYTGNFDSPTSSFSGNKGCNNFFAIYNRTRKFGGFNFYVHDAEHAMMAEVVSPGFGLNEDRVNLAMRTDGNRMVVSSFSVFHPQWLHYKLTANAEYRIRFMDRASELLQQGGLLSPESGLQRFDARVDQLDKSIIAESARWGDSWKSYPFTKDDTWLPEIKKVREIFFPKRSDILKQQLKAAALYSGLETPFAKNNGTLVPGTYQLFGNSYTLRLENPNSQGIIYYTLDDTDPRLIGGGISPSAKDGGTSVDILTDKTLVVKARIYNNDNWSALKKFNLLNLQEDYSSLRVTELMYHPPDVISRTDTLFGTALEFIELKNIGDHFIHLSGCRFDSAINYVFPENTILGPGKFLVIASKPRSFAEFYDVESSSNFSGNFSNGGERVILSSPDGQPIIDFSYDDLDPWPGKADGGGYSLVAAENNPQGLPSDPFYWQASMYLNGSPFYDDQPTAIEPLPHQPLDIRMYPNPTSDLLVIENSTNEEEAFLEICDISGKKILQQNFTGYLELLLKDKGMAEGIYIVTVYSGDRIVQKKIVFTP